MNDSPPANRLILELKRRWERRLERLREYLSARIEPQQPLTREPTTKPDPRKP